MRPIGVRLGMVLLLLIVWGGGLAPGQIGGTPPPQQEFATLRDQGVEALKAGQYRVAVDRLSQAQGLRPRDGQTILALGAAYEGLEQYDAAIQEYRKFTEVGRFSRVRKQIRARLDYLIRQKLAQEARTALAREAEIQPEAIPENTVAVFYFNYLGQNEDLAPLQKGLAELVITDLAQVKALTVVERLRLQKLMEEMALGVTGLVDPATAPRVGRLLGAGRLVNGTFLDLTKEELRIDAGLVRSKAPEAEPARAEASGALERLFRLEKELVFGVLDRMGITLSPEEREAIQRRIPTESLAAYIAYSRGLDLADRGQYAQAQAEFKKAVQADPNFQEAGAQAEEAARLETASQAPTPVAVVETYEQAAESASGSLERRLGATGGAAETGTTPGTSGQTGQTPQAPPSTDERQPAQDPGGGGLGGGGRIQIRVPLPPESRGHR